ncbi:hypothetical protein ASG92_21395 [Arthrobacter sp. Soil736]|nr:hypothetical protein ASG92_21395 [Arthrobacter sp. Soil736]
MPAGALPTVHQTIVTTVQCVCNPAKRLVTDALSTLKRIDAAGRVLCRADSAFYGHATVASALAGGAEVSVTVRMDPAVKRAITRIPETAWATIEYTDAVFDETTNTWVSRAEVAEIEFTAFTSRKKAAHVTGRLNVRRIPELNPKDRQGQGTLFDAHGITRFSPRLTPRSWTRSRRTKPTANTRLSSRSTPT